MLRRGYLGSRYQQFQLASNLAEARLEPADETDPAEGSVHAENY